MGYYVEISESTFSFDKNKSDKIIETIKEFTKSYKKRLQWIKKDEVLKSTTILEIFSNFRLELEYEEITDTYEIDYMSGEKLGNYELDFYKVIAPYVNDGYIQYCGEDREQWRYVFKNGECEEVYPTTCWN